MSASYTSILWNKQKKAYDIGIAIFIFSFLVVFAVTHFALYPTLPPATILIKGFGLVAFLLLHVILVTGPLARLDKRFLVILYNRRHLGVTMFIFALAHGAISLFYFHGLGNENLFRSLFLANTNYNSLVNFPFQVLGFFALIIFAIMAVTSHDFWLKNLNPIVWKSLHMLVYVAYGLIIMHVILGVVQDEKTSLFFFFTLIGFVGVSSLHLYASRKEVAIDKVLAKEKEGFLFACNIEDIPDTKAKMVTVENERVAIFKYEGKISAVHNVCRHQGGPLGEGKIIDGCITCPWHGYQYYPGNGQSPPPFTEKVETYHLKLIDNQVWINPKAEAAGTPVEPISLN